MKRFFCTMILLLMAMPAMSADDDWYMVVGKGRTTGTCVASPSPTEMINMAQKSGVKARISAMSIDGMKFIEVLDGSGDMMILIRGAEKCQSMALKEKKEAIEKARK